MESVVPAKAILGIRIPLLVATTSSCEDGLGLDIPMPTCACALFKKNRNKRLNKSICLFIINLNLIKHDFKPINKAYDAA
ncbi:hypothetical protein D3C87_1439240 [compost metagenome]